MVGAIGVAFEVSLLVFLHVLGFGHPFAETVLAGMTVLLSVLVYLLLTYPRDQAPEPRKEQPIIPLVLLDRADPGSLASPGKCVLPRTTGSEPVSRNPLPRVMGVGGTARSHPRTAGTRGDAARSADPRPMVRHGIPHRSYRARSPTDPLSGEET
jgi:hypothetical protein